MPNAQGGFAFAFVEGALATALRDGSWLLLDEVCCDHRLVLCRERVKPALPQLI